MVQPWDLGLKFRLHLLLPAAVVNAIPPNSKGTLQMSMCLNGDFTRVVDNRCLITYQWGLAFEALNWLMKEETILNKVTSIRHPELLVRIREYSFRICQAANLHTEV